MGLIKKLSEAPAKPTEEELDHRAIANALAADQWAEHDGGIHLEGLPDWLQTWGKGGPFREDKDFRMRGLLNG